MVNFSKMAIRNIKGKAAKQGTEKIAATHKKALKVVAGSGERRVQHEVVWSPDDTDDSRLAVLLYIAGGAPTPHTLVLLPDTQCSGRVEATMRAAGIMCATLHSPADAATLQLFNTGHTPVLLANNFAIKKKLFTELKMVIHYRVAGDAGQYRQVLSEVACGRAVTVTTILAQEDKPTLRQIMLDTGHPFTQRTVLSDVLGDIREQLKNLQQQHNKNTATEDVKREQESNSEDEQQQQSIAAAPAHAKASNKSSTCTTPSLDPFYDQLEPNSISGLDPLKVRTASSKSRRKKQQRKTKQQQQREENRLSDTDTDDDDDSDDDDDDDHQQQRKPRRPLKGKSQRSSVPPRKKRKSFTEALTNVDAKGLKKYRNALTFEEKKEYKNKMSIK